MATEVPQLAPGTRRHFGAWLPTSLSLLWLRQTVRIPYVHSRTLFWLRRTFRERTRSVVWLGIYKLGSHTWAHHYGLSHPRITNIIDDITTITYLDHYRRNRAVSVLSDLKRALGKHDLSW